MLLLTFFSAVMLSESQPIPTDNPVATLYGNGSYHWTSQINWTNVVAVRDFGGDLVKAQAALVKSGGGVLFLSASKYTLTENFGLASNVVLRGVPAPGVAKKGTEKGNLDPTTVLSCPDRKHIGILNLNGTNLGLVNIKLDGCAVMLWPTLAPQKWSMKDYWYEATSIVSMGSNKLVLGCVVQNVNLDSSNPDAPSDGWPWSFSTAIAVYSDENALVANNLLPPATLKATMKLSSGESVPYPYDNRYGIDVNKVLLGGAFGHLVPGATPGHCTDAKMFPWSFRNGLVIRDNYVFGNGRVGISFSGGGDGKTIGSGTQVISNHVEHEKSGIFYGFSPSHSPHGSDTNENRGYDQSGSENNVTLNTGHIYRQQLYNQKYETVDGEGILVQCTNGNNQYRNLWDRNDLSGGGSGYIAYYGVDIVQDCVITNNRVNPDQSIGLMNSKTTQAKGLQCHGNTPKANCNPTRLATISDVFAGVRTAPGCKSSFAKSGVFHITNPGLNAVQLLLCTSYDNVSSTCAPEAVVACDSSFMALIDANVSRVKYYNVSSDSTQAYAFAFWATQALSYHELESVPRTIWLSVPPGAEPEINVTYPDSPPRGVYCDSDLDCINAKCDKVCQSPPPPLPPPPPFPPIPIPAATDCELNGSWGSHPKADINISTTSTKGTVSFVCVSHTEGCIGWSRNNSGLIVLSETDNTVLFKLTNGTAIPGLINNTYTCQLMTILDTTASKMPIEWSKKRAASAPPFNLNVNSATYLGTPTSPFVPVAAVFLQSATTTSSEVALIAGNGPQTFGLSPQDLLGADSSSNATLALLNVKVAPPRPVARFLVGERIDHATAASCNDGRGDFVAVTGSFGVALLKFSPPNSIVVVWNNSLPRAEVGSCGLCCSIDARCRVSVGGDGTLALVLPARGFAVATFDRSGQMLGYQAHHATITDVEIVNAVDGLKNAVITSGFFDSNTGHEPMVMPSLIANTYDMSSEIFRSWPWGSGHPYREPGPCNGDVADSRAMGVKTSKTAEQLLFLGRSDGGNGIFGCQTDNVTQAAPLLGNDEYSEPFNMQAQAISYLGRLKSATGQILDGTLNLVRLPERNMGNTLHTVAVDEDASGNLWYAQTAACCIQNMANLTIQGQPLLSAGDGLVVEVMAGNLSTRLLWHHFAKAEQPTHSNSAAVDISVGSTVTLVVGTASQLMVEVNPIDGSSGPSGTTPVPQQGYLVVIPQSAVL